LTCFDVEARSAYATWTLTGSISDIGDLYRGQLEHYSNAKCAFNSAFTYSGAIGDAVIDAIIYLLPIPYIWGLRQIRFEQRMGLVVVFGLGLVYVALHQLPTSQSRLDADHIHSACVFALIQIPFIISNYRTRDGEQCKFSEPCALLAT